MKIYSPDLLKRLRRWADSHGVMLIADEIMTGFGRTGKMLACEHAGITPDFICLSKGLTAGWGPMSVVLCSSETYQAFYDDYFSGKGFLHSNTFTGYALAAAAALETINIYKTEKIVENVAERSSGLLGKLQKIADKIGALRNVRGIGFIAAADIVSPSSGKPYPREERMGYQVYREAVKQGALLRPLGDTIYFFPPLNTPESVLNELAEIAEATLERCLK
jgi:adenosylmethionine-8-amino-7-oxononanoate aminotransferase